MRTKVHIYLRLPISEFLTAIIDRNFTKKPFNINEWCHTTFLVQHTSISFMSRLCTHLTIKLTNIDAYKVTLKDYIYVVSIEKMFCNKKTLKGSFTYPN